MPFASNSLRITIGGSLFDVETWSIGFRARSTTPESNASLIAGNAGMADDIYTDFSAGFANSQLHANSQATCDWVKVAALDTDGHYADGSDADLHAEVVGAGPAGGGSADAPQLCTVVSFGTVVHRGHASKGRVFIPGCAQSTITATGEISTGAAGDIRDEMKDRLDHINGILSTAFSANMRLAVMSPLGAGLSHSITDVKVGRVIDTQRRRRRQLDEAYSDIAPLD